jgi:hypothetical protein
MVKGSSKLLKAHCLVTAPPRHALDGDDEGWRQNEIFFTDYEILHTPTSIDDKITTNVKGLFTHTFKYFRRPQR